MTEAEWLAATRPEQMLELFYRTATPWRKLWLFASACLTRIEEFIPEGPCSRAVEVAQQFASKGEWSQEAGESLAWAHHTLEQFWGGPVHPLTLVEYYPVSAVYGFLQRVGHERVGADVASAARGAPARRVWRIVAHEDDPQSLVQAKEGMDAVEREEANHQCDLVRCIFGNPFRPIIVDPAWLTVTVVRLAELIYRDRSFEHLPVLGDALEDAGCTNRVMLEHCRSPKPHARGCWVVDSVLSKE